MVTYWFLLMYVTGIEQDKYNSPKLPCTPYSVVVTFANLMNVKPKKVGIVEKMARNVLENIPNRALV